jgi:hypothetical protein
MPFTVGGVTPSLIVAPAARKESIILCDTKLAIGAGNTALLLLGVGSSFFLQDVKIGADNNKNIRAGSVFFKIFMFTVLL